MRFKSDTQKIRFGVRRHPHPQKKIKLENQPPNGGGREKKERKKKAVNSGRDRTHKPLGPIIMYFHFAKGIAKRVAKKKLMYVHCVKGEAISKSVASHLSTMTQQVT
jgi:hypothetical protein